MTTYVLGLDLGPAAEFTALAVVQATGSADPSPDLQVGHLHRFPPGTPYAAIAREVARLRADDRLSGAHLVVDVTAVGAGVLELFRSMDRPPDLVPVVITVGHRTEWGPGGTWRVPKKDLVTGLQLLLQDRRLHIAVGLPEAKLLSQELVHFRARTKLVADPQQAEWREGQDDDLVLAVALACWHVSRTPVCPESGFSVFPRDSPLAMGSSFLGGRQPW